MREPSCEGMGALKDVDRRQNMDNDNTKTFTKGTGSRYHKLKQALTKTCTRPSPRAAILNILPSHNGWVLSRRFGARREGADMACDVRR
jgi:hypothetical protein